jgi:hypothetical protein
MFDQRNVIEERHVDFFGFFFVSCGKVLISCKNYNKKDG